MACIKNNWLTLLGISLTVVYILAFLGIASNWNLEKLDPNEVGDFLAGFFAPLAFLWLVIGYLQNNTAIKLQSQELKHSVQALDLQTQELKYSVDEMKQANETSHQQLQSIQSNERHAKRDLFTRLADLQIKQLDALAKHIISSVDIQRYSTWRGSDRLPGHGDINFLLLQTANQLEQQREKFNTEQHSKNTVTGVRGEIKQYLTLYESLLSQAKEYDDEGELAKLFEQSAYEKFYQAIKIVAVIVFGEKFHPEA